MLKNLFLIDNQLKTIPECIGSLNKLEGLNISNNQLTSIPKSLTSLKSLEYLIIMKNSLKSIPESIGLLQNLKTLYLEGNQITSIPESIGSLKELVTLDIRNNQLNSIPESIGLLKSLRALLLGSNRLTSIPESICSLQELISLWLSDNQLKFIPKGIDSMKSLNHLYLRNNKFTYFPKKVKKKKRENLENFEKEIESFKKTLEIDPKNLDVWYNMGFAYAMSGEHKKAIETYGKVLEINPTKENIWQDMGSSYGKIGNFEKAIESYKKAVIIKSNDIISWYNMGHAYGRSGDHVNAIESYKEVVRINQKFIQAWNSMGYEYSKIKNFEKAIESYEKVIGINSKDIQAWFKMGNVFMDIENFEKAIESYEKVVEIEPKKIGAWNNMGIAYEKLGNHEKAVESFEKTILMDKFKFLRDDVLLCPRVNVITGKQNLTLQKVNLDTNEVEFEDFIDCIHTAVTDISHEVYEDYQNDANTQEYLNRKILEIRSSEKLTEINLTPEEKFRALKSWAAGIAEAGVNAFFIQNEIDKNLDLLYPITHFLMRFIAKVDRDFLTKYIAKIEKECMFEGTRHESSFLANTIPILEMVWANYLKNKMIESVDIEIVKTLVALDNSDKLFKTNTHFLILLMLAEPEYAKSIMIPEENVETHKKLDKLNFIDFIPNYPKEKKKTKIKSLAADTLKNQWENDEYTIGFGTSFCHEAENRIKSIIPDFFKKSYRCKICLCPKILCGSEEESLNYDDKSLTSTIFEKYWDGDSPEKLPKIANIKNKPEVKLMVEAHHILHETGELNKKIINRIKDVNYEDQREKRKIEITWLAYDFLHDYWENDDWIIGPQTDFCQYADRDFDFIVPDYFKVNENYNINLCPNILCDYEICPVYDYGEENSLSYAIYEKYGQENERGKWIDLKIADVKDKPEIKLIVEALHMLHDTGELTADIIRKITEIIY